MRLSAAAVKRTIIGPSIFNRFSLGVGLGNNANPEYLTIINGGNVGIGSVAPIAKLHITTDGSSTNPETFTEADINFFLQNKNTTNNNLNAVAFGDASGWGIANLGTMNGQAAHTGKFFISTRPVGSGPLVRMLIDEDGNVGIGTRTPNKKLTVNGTIYGKEVKVDLSVPGPDYVFDDTYQLRPIDEVSDYVQQNKHLPEIPSASEMEKNGIDLGEMNMLLLKKIEELTLYVIDLKKENGQIKEEMKELKNERRRRKK